MLAILSPIWHAKPVIVEGRPAGVGHRHEPAQRQPRRPGPAGARSAAQRRRAHAGATVPGRGPCLSARATDLLAKAARPVETILAPPSAFPALTPRSAPCRAPSTPKVEPLTDLPSATVARRAVADCVSPGPVRASRGRRRRRTAAHVQRNRPVRHRARPCPGLPHSQLVSCDTADVAPRNGAIVSDRPRPARPDRRVPSPVRPHSSRQPSWCATGSYRFAGPFDRDPDRRQITTPKPFTGHVALPVSLRFWRPTA